MLIDKVLDALGRIETEVATPEALHVVEFARRSERGICRPKGRPSARPKEPPREPIGPPG